MLVTGAGGLIGSEVVSYYSDRAKSIIGIDNNMRADFFGPEGDTRWNVKRLESIHPNFKNHDIDIRNREAVFDLFEQASIDVVVHCAAQPSHDLAASRPLDDFDVNAGGTLNLLEACRQHRPDAVFAHLSTNKVYGDAPNLLPLKELEKRYDFDRHEDFNGIKEDFTIDNSKHSIFGASKVAADIMVQEYGKYFGMKTVCYRGGCLTGPNHAGVELHGFLNYLVKVNVQGGLYKVFGYKGKQVRDNIHSLDVARAIDCYIENPRPGEVYNLGGGRGNSCSILEAFEMTESITGKPMNHEYVEKNREGDHICYISDLSKLKRDYPSWDITVTLDEIFRQIAESWIARSKTTAGRTFL
ncbi:MAG: NAD-dependent epimerase/dehydratase family protein [Desulfomonile tiedjei]|nr:NAD-dependent epimerase/dehydratase family protein [Desulfomonile tiedjei]